MPKWSLVVAERFDGLNAAKLWHGVFRVLFLVGVEGSRQQGDWCLV